MEEEEEEAVEKSDSYSDENEAVDFTDFEPIKKTNYVILDEQLATSNKFKSKLLFLKLLILILATRYLGTFMLTELSEADSYPYEALEEIFEAALNKTITESNRRDQPVDYLMYSVNSPLMDQPVNGQIQNVNAGYSLKLNIPVGIYLFRYC